MTIWIRVMSRLERPLLCVGLSSLLWACADGGSDECRFVSDCARGERCVDGACVPAPLDGGPAVDAGPERPPDAGDPERPDAGPPDPRDGGADDAGRPRDAGPGDAGPEPGPCGLEPCGLWRLGPAATSWQAWPTGDGTFAPSAPVQAAFDLESAGVAYVLTAGTYHVLRLSDRAWIEDGGRDELVPEASGARLRSAYTIPADHAGDGTVEGITLESTSSVYVYEMTLADRSIAFDRRIDDFSWSDPLAPTRASIRFAWLDVTNARGFASGDPSTLCDTSATSYGPYAGYVTATRVHLQDAGHCFAFLDRFAPTTAPPFSYVDAPSVGVIAGAFWNQGSLWLVGE